MGDKMTNEYPIYRPIETLDTEDGKITIIDAPVNRKGDILLDAVCDLILDGQYIEGHYDLEDCEDDELPIE